MIFLGILGLAVLVAGIVLAVKFWPQITGSAATPPATSPGADPAPVCSYTWTASGGGQWAWKSDALRRQCVTAACGGDTQTMLHLGPVLTGTTVTNGTLVSGGTACPATKTATSVSVLTCTDAFAQKPSMFAGCAAPDPQCTFDWSGASRTDPITSYDQAALGACYAASCSGGAGVTGDGVIGTSIVHETTTRLISGDPAVCGKSFSRQTHIPVHCAEAPPVSAGACTACPTPICATCPDTSYSWPAPSDATSVFTPTTPDAKWACGVAMCTNGSSGQDAIVGSVTSVVRGTLSASGFAGCPPTKTKILRSSVACKDAWSRFQDNFVSCNQQVSCVVNRQSGARTVTLTNVTARVAPLGQASVAVSGSTVLPKATIVFTRPTLLGSGMCGAGSNQVSVTDGSGTRLYCVYGWSFNSAVSQGALVLTPTSATLLGGILGNDPTALTTFYQDTVRIALAATRVGPASPDTIDMQDAGTALVAIGWESVDGVSNYEPLNLMRVCSLDVLTGTAAAPTRTSIACSSPAVNQVMTSTLLNKDVAHMYVAMPTIVIAAT